MQHDDRGEQRDAGTLGDAQRARRDPSYETNPDPPDQMGHAGIRKKVPGERDDLNADNSQGFTGEVGDRERQFSGSEAARRKVPPDEAGNPRSRDRVPHQRETAELSPDDFDTEDTID